jgi:hypothetical protein
MDLNKKIEEIRRKPEHIRLRYVWGSVAISMIFIVIIWIFSLNESAKNMHPLETKNLPDIKQSIDQMKSIQDAMPALNDAANNAVQNLGTGNTDTTGQLPAGNNGGNVTNEGVSNPQDNNNSLDTNSENPLLPTNN